MSDVHPTHHGHPNHQAIIKRLKRAEGHLRSTLGMMEVHRPCLELAQQLHAVEKAICQAKRLLIHDHLDHCLDSAMDADDVSARNKALDEFREITRYL